MTSCLARLLAQLGKQLAAQTQQLLFLCLRRRHWLRLCTTGSLLTHRLRQLGRGIVFSIAGCGKRASRLAAAARATAVAGAKLTYAATSAAATCLHMASSNNGRCSSDAGMRTHLRLAI